MWLISKPSVITCTVPSTWAWMKTSREPLQTLLRSQRMRDWWQLPPCALTLLAKSSRFNLSNGGADGLWAQRHVQLEKVAAQLIFLPRADGLLHSKVLPEDEIHGGFSHGLRVEANCVRVVAVFQQWNFTGMS